MSTILSNIVISKYKINIWNKDIKYNIRIINSNLYSCNTKKYYIYIWLEHSMIDRHPKYLTRNLHLSQPSPLDWNSDTLKRTAVHALSFFISKMEIFINLKYNVFTHCRHFTCDVTCQIFLVIHVIMKTLQIKIGYIGLYRH